jgi:hypothetical protein
MQRIAIMQGGDGSYRADTSNRGQVAVKTASYTVKLSDPTIFSNKGATGAVLISLPTAKAGAWFTILKATNQTFGFQATGGAKINAGTANKKYSNTASEAGIATCTVISDGTDWFVVSQIGTWAVDNT